MLDHDWYCERAGQEVSALAAVIADAPDVTQKVPSCPGWTVADLAQHTGVIHRWATSIVATEAGARVPFPEATEPSGSADGWARWLESGAVPLLGTLRSAGPLTAVWSWGPGRTSGWWARRILHETAVHRADAELALGVAAPVIDPVVAADGIDEFLFNLPSARRPYPHLASLPTGASLHLHATDADGEWMIRFTDSGIGWERGHDKATAAIRGPVSSLLLFTYGRLPASDAGLTSFGDASIPALWQDKTAL
ncbi:MAG: maleylpyruvate isomerase family mycothiol-dependent enzyme [Solirubrobacteraceae bacterium]